MTREYILQNLEVMCPIIFIDNPGLRDYVMSTLQDSLLIPKAKFKKGDQVYIIAGAVPYGPEILKIEKPLFSIEDGIYSYTLEECDFRVDEDELDYYIEEKEEEAELPE